MIKIKNCRFKKEDVAAYALMKDGYSDKEWYHIDIVLKGQNMPLNVTFSDKETAEEFANLMDAIFLDKD